MAKVFDMGPGFQSTPLSNLVSPVFSGFDTSELSGVIGDYGDKLKKDYETGTDNIQKINQVEGVINRGFEGAKNQMLAEDLKAKYKLDDPFKGASKAQLTSPTYAAGIASRTDQMMKDPLYKEALKDDLLGVNFGRNLSVIDNKALRSMAMKDYDKFKRGQLSGASLDLENYKPISPDLVAIQMLKEAETKIVSDYDEETGVTTTKKVRDPKSTELSFDSLKQNKVFMNNLLAEYSDQLNSGEITEEEAFQDFKSRHADSFGEVLEERITGGRRKSSTSSSDLNKSQQRIIDDCVGNYTREECLLMSGMFTDAHKDLVSMGFLRKYREMTGRYPSTGDSDDLLNFQNALAAYKEEGNTLSEEEVIRNYTTEAVTDSEGDQSFEIRALKDSGVESLPDNISETGLENNGNVTIYEHVPARGVEGEEGYSPEITVIKNVGEEPLSLPAGKSYKRPDGTLVIADSEDTAKSYVPDYIKRQAILSTLESGFYNDKELAEGVYISEEEALSPEIAKSLLEKDYHPVPIKGTDDYILIDKGKTAVSGGQQNGSETYAGKEANIENFSLINTKGEGNHYLSLAAAKAFNNTEGTEDIEVESSLRSDQEQATIKENNPHAAPPGKSDHNTGNALDLRGLLEMEPAKRKNLVKKMLDSGFYLPLPKHPKEYNHFVFDPQKAKCLRDKGISFEVEKAGDTTYIIKDKDGEKLTNLPDC